MSVTKKNIAANFSGNLWVGVMGLVFVPIYIHFIGMEAYGLIGIFATLLAIFSLLDFGIGATINREMARLSVKSDNNQDLRDLLRTLEVPYWGAAVLLGISVVVLSSFIAYHWVQSKSLSPRSVHRAIMIMGVVLAFQWPMGLYAGGMRGLQRQVVLNVIDAVMATIRGIGAVLILWLVSPTIEAFFIWQVVISLTHTGIIASFLWRSLPKSAGTPRFRFRLLKECWRFAAGIAGTNILSTILRQVDKVILSKMLSLEYFGYYNLAGVVAINLSRFSGPVVKAVYPKLAGFVAIGSTEEITRLYHKSAQAVSFLIFPVIAVLTLYPKELLLLWTRDSLIAENSYVLVRILVVGTALNNLLYIPYALQLAYGWTKLGLMLNLFSTVLAIPLLIVLTQKYGAIGAGTAWIVLNGALLIIAVQIMHQRLLPLEKWRWYLNDIALPFFAAFSCAAAIRISLPVPTSDIFLCAYLVIVSTIILGITAWLTPVTRAWVQDKMAL